MTKKPKPPPRIFVQKDWVKLRIDKQNDFYINSKPANGEVVIAEEIEDPEYLFRLVQKNNANLKINGTIVVIEQTQKWSIVVDCPTNMQTTYVTAQDLAQTQKFLCEFFADNIQLYIDCVELVLKKDFEKAKQKGAFSIDSTFEGLMAKEEPEFIFEDPEPKFKFKDRK